MGFNFRKIAAIGTSVLLAGMTMGFAAAANYPAPFVQNGASNVAIVVGSSALPADSVTAGNIVTNLNSSLSSSTSSGGSVIVSGENIPLFSSSSQIYLNSSLTAVKNTLTSTDLPSTLATSSFTDGSVTATVTPTITLNAGNGGPNSNNRVVFAKQPTSSNDPVDGLSMNTSTGAGLYNITIGFSSAVNFTKSTAQGNSLNLFGNNYYVSPSTTTTQLVLFKSAVPQMTLTQGDTKTVTVNGVSYTVGLGAVGGSTTGSNVQVTVNGVTQNVPIGSTISISGLSVAITAGYPSSGVAAAQASILVGANPLTFQSGTTVLQGSSNTPIIGTTAYFSGTPANLTQLTINVAASNNNNNTILAGQSFMDPVFGGFQVTYGGLTNPINSTSRDSVFVSTDGTSTNQITMTPLGGSSAASFDFASNSSGLTGGVYNLTTVNGYTLSVYEGTNLTQNSYAIIGSPSENYGYLIQVASVNGGTGGTQATGGSVSLTNVLSPSQSINVAYTGAYQGQFSLPDGSTYTFTYNGSGSSGWISIKYPTSIDSSGQYVLYPTIQAKGNEKVGVYAPLNISLSNTDGQNNNVSGILVPNGNGYQTISVQYMGNGNGTTATADWKIGGTTIQTGYNATDTNATFTTVNVTLGSSSKYLTYNFTTSAAIGINKTMVYLVQPGSTSNMATPAIVTFEPKDVNGNYNAIVVPTTSTTSGSSTYVGTGSTAYFTQSTLYGPLTLYSNTKQSQWVDGFGSLVTLDTSNSNYNTMTLSLPNSQSTAQVYVSSVSASVSSSGGSANIGNIIVSDSQVSSVNTKNLIVLGGSCVNSAAATLLGVPMGTCTTDWTTATSVGSGQFLVQSFSSSSQNLTSGIAVLVAGYDAPDTLAAATWLTTSKTNGVGVDLSPGKKYTGTTTTGQATLVS